MGVNRVIAATGGLGLALWLGACSAGASDQDTSNVIETIPLTVQQGRTLVEVSIGDSEPATFLLDTGGSNGLLTRSFVESAGLSLGEPRELRSPLGGNVQMVDTASFATVSFGDLDLPGGSSLIMEDDQFPLPGVSGVVSLLPFRDYMVELDLAGEELRVVSAPGKDVHWHPHPAGQPFYTLDLHIGDATIPAHIDSGNPGLITLPLEYAEQLPLKGELSEVGRFRTVDAERIIYGATLEAPIGIGGVTYPPGPVQFAELPFANVGSQALLNWVLVIDAPGERFALYPQD